VSGRLAALARSQATAVGPPAALSSPGAGHPAHAPRSPGPDAASQWV